MSRQELGVKNAKAGGTGLCDGDMLRLDEFGDLRPEGVLLQVISCHVDFHLGVGLAERLEKALRFCRSQSLDKLWEESVEV